MSIRQKVNIIFLLIIIMMSSIPLCIYYVLTNDIRTYDQILANFLSANKLPGYVRDVYQDIETYQDLPSQELRSHIKNNLRIAGELVQTIHDDTCPDHTDSLSTIEGMTKMIDTITEDAIAAMQIIDRQQVNETLLDSIDLLDSAVELSRENIDAYLARELEHTVSLRKEIIKKNERLIIALFGSMLAFSLAALLVGVLFANKWVIFPLRYIVTSVRNIASGELDTSVPHGGNDEIGELASDIDKMRASIKEMTKNLKEREQLRRILAQIANVFLTIPEKEIFGEVLAIVLQVMESKYGLFGFIEENKDLVIPSLTGEVWNECQVSGKSTTFPPDTWGDSLWARSIREQKALFSDGPFHTPEGHVHIGFFLSVPIIFGKDTIGLFAVANKKNSYTEKDRNLLESIADYISPILNARLQRDRKEREREEAEEALRQLNLELDQRVLNRTAQLEAANKELDAFAYSVSHDLRAPLRHIDGYIELLIKKAGKALSEEERHYMETISDAAQKMGLLIDDLLSFSRMGRQSLSLNQVDLGLLVRDVIRECEPDTAGRNIDWRIGDLPEAYGDGAMLRMVLGNLIANALKFTRPRQRARIEIDSLPGKTSEIVIVVRDNGVGFDMAYADRLFGVFQRLHRADEFEGTGIGLANVRRIITRHGGRTWAEGRLDRGAAFYFSLPLDILPGLKAEDSY